MFTGEIMTVSLKTIYSEIKLLRQEMKTLRSALIPEEKISSMELEELHQIEARMKKGEKIRLQDAIEELNV
ncbi:MAG: hypothetical protein WAW23_03105 [Candidatus Methanoperedens sp.]